MPHPRLSIVKDDGFFSEDGQSFIISRPDTPRPLVNVISMGNYGVSVAQTGAGSSWARRPSEPVTQGYSRSTRDAGGRALYLRDERSARSWSVGWQPLRVRPESYECIHGVGYTLINSKTNGIHAQWLMFVPFEEPMEVWRVRIKNQSKKPRTLSLWTGIDWAAEPASAADEALFVRDGGNILLAKASPTVSGGRGEGVFFHACHLPTRAHALDRRALWGAYGSSEQPEALMKGRYLAGHGDPEAFASLCVPITLKPGEERSVLFTIGRAETRNEGILKAKKFQDFAQVDHAWNRSQLVWDKYLSSFTVDSPDKGFNLLTNTWLKYLALSQGVWGGRGPRDTRIFLPLEPSRVRREILNRAGRATPDHTHFNDVPWPVLLLAYLRETGDGLLLAEKIASKTTVYEAALKSAREIAAVPDEEEVGSSRFFSDWTEMTAWAVEEDFLPAREKETARKLRAEAEKRPAASGKNNGSADSVRALENACRRGLAQEACDIYRRLAPPPVRGVPPFLFAPETSDSGAFSPAALFRACTEGILGLQPEWGGLRVRPCLPPGWRSAEVRREFRGTLFSFRFRRKASKPAGFQEILLNGKIIKGDVLPEILDRKADVVVTVGRAR